MFSISTVLIFITVVHSAPLQLQMLQPILQPQQLLPLPLQDMAQLQLMQSQQKLAQMPLLQQLLALQQLQALQRLNVQNSIKPVTSHLQRPLLILLPKTKSNNHRVNTKSNNEHLKSNNGIINEDADSIIVDAEPDRLDQESQKAILLMPNEGRLSLGGIISNIPFLPIEVNVPDSISWIYNGIAGIISGIGQRWPFRPQAENMQDDMQNPQMKTIVPVLIMPLNQSI